MQKVQSKKFLISQRNMCFRQDINVQHLACDIESEGIGELKKQELMLRGRRKTNDCRQLRADGAIFRGGKKRHASL